VIKEAGMKESAKVKMNVAIIPSAVPSKLFISYVFFKGETVTLMSGLSEPTMRLIIA